MCPCLPPSLLSSVFPVPPLFVASQIGTKRDLQTVTATTDRIARLLLQVGACLPACLPAYPPACLPTRLTARLPARLPACPPARPLAYLPGMHALHCFHGDAAVHVVWFGARTSSSHTRSSLDLVWSINLPAIQRDLCLFQVRSLRLGGSCALDLAGVACGRLDIFFELGFGGPW